MTDFPDLKIKALVSFPASVLDGAGIDVVKQGGTYQFNLAYDDFAPPVGGVSDAAHQNALLWNNLTNSYVLAPITVIGAGGAVTEAPNDGVQYGRQALGWTPIVVGGVAPGTTNPLMDGVAAPGIATTYARGDHVHPTDTSRAPLASPTFTGTPAAPTAAPATNTTQIATTAFVSAAVSASGGVTPSALTRTSDTNVTLTLGGTPGTALLQATSITVGWSGTLAAARGGFGSDVSAASGVPLFASGVAAFTGTTGSGNFVRATSPTLVTPALGTPTSVTLTSATGLPLSTGVTGTLPVANGGTGDTGTAWASYTPTVTVAGGGAGNGSGRYKLVGKTLFINVTANITTGGTSATFTLPAGLTTAAADSFLVGREDAVIGMMFMAGFLSAGASSATVIKYDGTFAVTTGWSFAFSGVIEVA